MEPNPHADLLRIKQMREKSGMSLRRLATNALISPAYLSDIENGKRLPSISVVRRIVKALPEGMASVNRMVMLANAERIRRFKLSLEVPDVR